MGMDDTIGVRGGWNLLLQTPQLKGYHPDRVEIAASDKRGERIEIMSWMEWIIQLSIFGVMAMAVIGTVQKLVDAMKNKK
jgi:hypothetical protein